LKKHLGDAKEDWKICAWHFYDKYYHTGKYQEYGNIVSGDMGGESFYDYCKEQGAIIFSAHDHVYARTHVMSKFSEPVIDKYDSKTDAEVVQIRKGATFNILNGVGGYEIYIEQGEQKNYSHWQKKYALGANNENAKRFGGLYCKFNVGGNKRKAYCELQRINSRNKVFDKFFIYRNDDPANIAPKQLDEQFKSEKIKAYKDANHIVDGEEKEEVNANEENEADNKNRDISEENNINVDVNHDIRNDDDDYDNRGDHPSKKKNQHWKGILGGIGSFGIFILVLSGILFVIKRKKFVQGIFDKKKKEDYADNMDCFEV